MELQLAGRLVLDEVLGKKRWRADLLPGCRPVLKEHKLAARGDCAEPLELVEQIEVVGWSVESAAHSKLTEPPC